MTTRSFVKRLTALLRYKQALRDMNRYPDATAEDLGREDTCIICREEMRPWDPNGGQIERTRPKKLPCGHILHFGCLKSWLERQQVCPTCRSSVVMDQQPQRNDQFRPRMAFHIAPNLPNGQNQAAAANGQAPGVQDAQLNGQAAQGGQQPAAPRAGMRYINLGPIRLGFAQGGQEVAELANRMGVDLNGPNGPAMPQANLPTTTPTDLSTMEAVRSRLLEVDQRIQQEVRDIQQGIQNVQTAQQELQLINLMLAELARIRQFNHGQQLHVPAPNGQSRQPTPTPAAANTPVGGIPPANTAGGVPVAMPPMMPFPPGQFPLPTYPPAPPHPLNFRMNSPTVTRHRAASQTTAIPSGSPDLPEGVVIPPGWSLLPLQRLDGAAAATGGPAPTGSGSGPGSHVNLPDLVQQARNAQAPQPPVTAEDATSSTNGATAGHSELHNGDAQQPAHVSTAEPTQVAAPTPVTPHWGGSAQLFGGGSGGLPFGLVAPGSSRSTSQTREGGGNDANGEASNGGAGVEPGEPSGGPAVPTPASDLPFSEANENGLGSSSSTTAKGKAPAATVEDVEDES